MNITIPDSVTFIGNSVFRGCTSLKDIEFNGTKEQWHAITIESWWNEETGEFIVHCTDGDIAKEDA